MVLSLHSMACCDHAQIDSVTISHHPQLTINQFSKTTQHAAWHLLGGTIQRVNMLLQHSA
jgi:hypothetical protein